MTIPAPSASSDLVGLSVALREQTTLAHEQAETATFVQRLLAGELPLSAYTALVAQNYAIYRALEAAAEHWRQHPIAGPFVMDELFRVPNLEHDLAHLLGPDWRAEAERLRVPATIGYVTHLHDVCSEWPAGYVAHHYVRYLGDLSGGQVIKANIARIYGEDGHRSTGFYTFDAIDRIKPFRDRYRELLDHAPLTREQQQRVVAEAVVAFELNRAVFVDLAERHLPADPTDPPPSTGLAEDTVNATSGDGGEDAA